MTRFGVQLLLKRGATTLSSRDVVEKKNPRFMIPSIVRVVGSWREILVWVSAN